ncbi:MAG: DUF4372 domain-containing protein, partial [Aequorivita sp.]|nr:DUF4372 domain-containing protein [Aequorivita sp.]
MGFACAEPVEVYRGHLPRPEINKIASQYGADHYTKRFRTYDHLVTMLYGSFHSCRSLREVVT